MIQFIVIVFLMSLPLVFRTIGVTPLTLSMTIMGLLAIGMMSSMLNERKQKKSRDFSNR